LPCIASALAMQGSEAGRRDVPSAPSTLSRTCRKLSM